MTLQDLPEREANTLPASEITGERDEVSAVLLAHPFERRVPLCEAVGCPRRVRIDMALEDLPGKLSRPR